MSFIYPRTVSILREATVTTGIGGNVGYSGITPTTRTVLFSNLPASVQAPSIGSRRIGASVPADAPGPVVWNIFIPVIQNGPGLGDIKDRDFVIDDLGNTYLIAAAAWSPLGYTIRTIKEEA